MNISLIKNIFVTLLLILLQVIVLNQIHLFSYATPLLYVYIALKSPRDFPRWAILLWCFVTGLIIDVFSNTPGMAAGSMTLVGMIQPFILRMFVNRDTPDDITPSASTLGFGHYASYTTILVSVYCIVFFILETFSFFNWLQFLGYALGSAVLTIALLLVIENFKKE